MTGFHVSGGTNAGWRNPFQGAALPWQCDCLVADESSNSRVLICKTNIGALVACPDCGARRDG